MLRKARERTREDGLTNVQALHEMDAEATSFDDHAFDIAVGMFVASVVPNPRRLLAEMRRLVRPGGDILLVNHFAAAKGPTMVAGTGDGPGVPGPWMAPRFCDGRDFFR